MPKLSKSKSRPKKQESSTVRESYLGDLLQIIERADKRRWFNDGDVPWLVELPMTEEEYKRWVEITSWGENRNQK